MTRSEAIDALDNLLGMIEDNHGTDYDEAIKMAINALKQFERKKGKWIDPAAVDVYRCSVCEEYTKLEVPRLFYHYCPNCGAEMEGGEDA